MERDNPSMAFKHELSWSVSRSGTYAGCPRSYYYNYYLSWLGWKWDAPQERQLAYRLKKLTRLPMWAGDCLHDALAAWFGERRSGRERGADWVRDRALSELRRGFRESRDRGADWQRRPSKVTRLAEHYYGESSVDESGDNAKDYGTRFVERIESGVETFFGAAELERVRSVDPSQYLACEELGTIELFDTKVFAIPDFAFRDDDGTVWIYDWKTGSPREQDLFQLTMYVHYAQAVWDVDPDAVVCVDAYLPRSEFVERRFDAAEREAALERTQQSIEAMRQVHFDADEGIGDAEDFPLIPADSPESRSCAQCGFRELCGRA